MRLHAPGLVVFRSRKLSGHAFIFQFKLLSSLEDLFPSISLDQIPTTFGGNFDYDHDAWLQFRLVRRNNSP